MNVPRKVRGLVIDRDDHCCVRCGQWSQDGTLHHRKLRSQGGRHTPQNLIVLCWPCHGWVHANPGAAVAAGWVVPSWDDPLLTPVYWHRMSVLLTSNGSLTYQGTTNLSRDEKRAH